MSELHIDSVRHIWESRNCGSCEELAEKHDALAATVAALRKDKSDLLAYVNDAERWFNRHDPNGYVSPKREAAQQHLRDVRAEAIRQASNYLFFALGEPTDAVIALDKYAERVRAGEK